MAKTIEFDIILRQNSDEITLYMYYYRTTDLMKI